MSWRDAPIVEDKQEASLTKAMPPKPQEDNSWFMRNVAEPLGSREALQAYGATLGAIAPTVGAAGRGMSMLPHPLLKAAGYGLTALAGGVAGGMAAESARDVALPEGRGNETFEQQLNRNITDETTAQTFGYAAPLIASPFKKVAGAVTDALAPEARKLYDQAKSFGVDLAPANLKDSGFVDGVRKVFGVMPYVGSSWNKTAGKQTNQVEGAVNDLLNEIAPNATLYDAGVNLVKGAESTYKDFTSEAGKRYGAFREAAKALPNPNVFRTNNLRAAATEIGARRTAERIPDVNMPRDRLEDITEGLINAPEHLSIEQLRGFSRSINDEVARKSLAGEDVKDLLQLKKATEASMNDIDRTLLPEGSNVAESLAEANKFYATEIKKFQTAEAKKFGRVDKNMFDVGYVKAGTMPDDQAMQRIFNSKSPEALRQLRDVTGAKAFNVAARKHLEESMRGVVKDIGENTRIIDPEDFANKFQLDTEEGAAVMKELLSASNVKPEKVNQLLDVMRSVQRIQPTDPSTFLARRLVLGGGMMASAYGLGVPAAVSFGYIANRFGNALANPKALDSLIKSADKTISPRQQWAAMYRGVSALYGKDSNEAKDLRTRKDELIGAFEEYKKNPWVDAPIAEKEQPTRIDVTPADIPQVAPQSSLSNQDFMSMASATPFSGIMNSATRSNPQAQAQYESQLADMGFMARGKPTMNTQLPTRQESQQYAASDFNPSNDLFQRIAMAESSGNPNAKAKTSSASGLYQFTDGTFKAILRKYGKDTGLTMKDKNNPQAQEWAMQKLTAENSASLQKTLGREPTDGELYLAHFAGAGGAKRLLKANPNVPAARILPKAAKANKPIFYGNGKPLTVAQVMNKLAGKVS